jgi:phosphoglycerol transferase MdoB-like AlkP superfamily enzyme
MEKPATSGRDESQEERLDRNLGELLQELRVALPGVQVLFAFLLTVAFQQRFTSLTRMQEKIYSATLLSTAIAAALLIAPSAYHRLTFRYQQKEHLVFIANRLAILGLGFLALSMTGVILLVTDFIFSTTAAIVTSSISALVFALLWYALPLRRRIGVEKEIK